MQVLSIPISEVADPAVPVTFIKMDIEGAEVDALMGARDVITRDRPVLAVCVYPTPPRSVAASSADKECRSRLPDVPPMPRGRRLANCCVCRATRAQHTGLSTMKTISILTPCYNEEANVREVYERVRLEFIKLGRYGTSTSSSITIRATIRWAF